MVLVLNCPTALASPSDAAAAVARLATDGGVGEQAGPDLLAGEHTAREGRRILQDAGVASFETPADAAAAVALPERLVAGTTCSHAGAIEPERRRRE